MDKLISISEAAHALGVSPTTLRRWEKEGKLLSHRTHCGHRRYALSEIKPEWLHQHDPGRKTIAYARVSSHDQKTDLERQKQVLELYCARQGWTFEVIADLGSGMNYHKKGLKLLLNDILSGKIGRLVIAHKDRLLRFGAELIFAICEAKNVEVIILNQGEDTTFEEDLAKDVLEIITVFSARLYTETASRIGFWQTRRLNFAFEEGRPIFGDKYSLPSSNAKVRMPGQPKPILEAVSVYGSRSRKNQKLLDGVKRAVEEAGAC